MSSKNTKAASTSAPVAVKAGDLLGGGVLKKTFAPITGLFDGFESNKISAVSKSSHGENVKLDLAGSRSLGENAAAENSVTLRLNQKKYGLNATASSGGKVNLNVSVAEPVKGASVNAGVSRDLVKNDTTVTSAIDFKNDRVTGNVTFTYPWGKALEADASFVASQSGVSVGARASVSTPVGGADKNKVALKALQAALGYKQGRVQVGVVYSQAESRRVTAAVAADVAEGAKAGVATTLNVGGELKPEVRVGGQFKVNDQHTVRSSVSINTGDVALQLASQWNKQLKTNFTAAVSVPNKKPSFGLGIDLQH